MMADVKFSILPETVQDAAEDAVMFLQGEDVPLEILDHEKTPPVEFATFMHHSYGPFFRNSWCLWWEQQSAYKFPDWPQEKPRLMEYYEGLGITYPDDIFFITMIQAWAVLHKMPVNIDYYIAQTKIYWHTKGYTDGVWKKFKNL